MLSLAKDKSTSDLIAWLSNPQAGDDTGYIVEPIRAISANKSFKYSRPFAIGIYTLLEESDSELVKDQEKRNEILDTIIENFGLTGDKMKKDLELYRGNLEKMTQLLKVIEDVLEASRKQREKREQEKQNDTNENKEVEVATAE